MRPLYETQQDLHNEGQVLARICAAWECEGTKLPLTYKVDYALTRHGEIKAWAEIKCRNTEYPDMWVSLKKWMAGVRLSKTTGRPFVLVYCFKHKVYWKAVQDDLPVIRIGGRTDRSDWQDVEPMAVFSLKDFQVL